jgi:[ribosomal protein S5]-alanine N-acetyltransferase
VLPPPPEGLRHWRLADAPALEAAWADPSIRLWNPPPESADAASWIMRCGERWSLGLSVDFVIDVDGEVGGEVGLRNFTTDPPRAELGVWVAEAYRGQGLGTRSVRSVTEWARDELGLSQLWCRTSVSNEHALALFSQAGWDRLGEVDGRVLWAI